MPYHVDDDVVHPVYGVGHIVSLAMQRFFDVQARLYYEISIQRNTVWVPVDTSVASGLRPVTPKSELARYRRILRSRPVPLAAKHLQRHQDLVQQLKSGRFQNVCEVVRDLTARRWLKPLNDFESATLRKSKDNLCQEWATAAGVSPSEALTEIDALLLAGRQAYHKPGR